MSDEATETETVAAAAEPDDEDATQMDVGVAETPNTPTAYSEDTEPPALVEYKQTRRRVLALAAGILAVACAIAGGIVAWDASRATAQESYSSDPIDTRRLTCGHSEGSSTSTANPGWRIRWRKHPGGVCGQRSQKPPLTCVGLTGFEPATT